MDRGPDPIGRAIGDLQHETVARDHSRRRRVRGSVPVTRHWRRPSALQDGAHRGHLQGQRTGSRRDRARTLALCGPAHRRLVRSPSRAMAAHQTRCRRTSWRRPGWRWSVVAASRTRRGTHEARHGARSLRQLVRSASGHTGLGPVLARQQQEPGALNRSKRVALSAGAAPAQVR